MKKEGWYLNENLSEGLHFYNEKSNGFDVYDNLYDVFTKYPKSFILSKVEYDFIYDGRYDNGKYNHIKVLKTVNVEDEIRIVINNLCKNLKNCEKLNGNERIYNLSRIIIEYLNQNIKIDLEKKGRFCLNNGYGIEKIYILDITDNFNFENYDKNAYFEYQKQYEELKLKIHNMIFNNIKDKFK